jgi:predicted MFS family arabinose efflux permease
VAQSGGGPAAAKTLAILFAINTMNFFDRQILGAVGEPVRREWQLSDGALGLLGTAFTLLYAFVGVPLGRLADRKPRTLILAAGVFVWSALTALSGMARSFWQLFVVRLGVGVGEATCAPAATSLVGDLFSPTRRARALGVFMMGLPVGIALSYLVSGYVARAWGWRAAFYVAGLPGLLCAAAMLLVREPPRGQTEAHAVGARTRPGSPYLLVLGTPTMWWIILSGALHNFNMYALGAWLAPYLMRYHGTDIAHAGLILTGAYGLAGAPGLLLGGVAADAMLKRRRDGRLLLGAVCLAASAPLLWATLQVGRGALWPFALLLSAAVALMYVYYAVVYSVIQAVLGPSLRGPALAPSCFAMYVTGASFGTWVTGLASDFYTRRAADAAGVAARTAQALEPFRATGLQSALELLPVLGVLLALVVWASSRTVTRDMDRLQEWMRAESA